MIRSKHWFPKNQYIVAVTRRGKTYYFYGETRKEAISAAGLKDGEVFTSRFYAGGPKIVCELTHNGRIVREYR